MVTLLTFIVEKDLFASSAVDDVIADVIRPLVGDVDVIGSTDCPVDADDVLQVLREHAAVREEACAVKCKDTVANGLCGAL